MFLRAPWSHLEPILSRLGDPSWEPFFVGFAMVSNFREHRSADNAPCVTISLDLKFIGASKIGDEIIGKVKILKKTKTLVFLFCELKCNDKTITSASVEAAFLESSRESPMKSATSWISGS